MSNCPGCGLPIERARNVDRLIALASAQAEYLAHVPTERFNFPLPQAVETSFYKISAYLEKQLLPKEHQ